MCACDARGLFLRLVSKGAMVWISLQPSSGARMVDCDPVAVFWGLGIADAKTQCGFV